MRNAITALAMVDITGGDLAAAAAGLAEASVPGRMQRVHLGPDAPVVYVDFAHTPQAVTAALEAVGSRPRIAVLGCGGDRDPEKRGPMGAAAARHADLVVVTDDNPRSEDPAAIRAEVLAGARAARAAGREVVDGGDRRSAIRLALPRARPATSSPCWARDTSSARRWPARCCRSRRDVASAEWAALRQAGER